MNYYIINNSDEYADPLEVIKTSLGRREAEGLVKKLWWTAVESAGLNDINKLDTFEALLEAAGFEVIANIDTIYV